MHTIYCIFLILQIRREAHYDDRQSPAIVLNAMYNDYSKHQPMLYALLIYDGFKSGECVPLQYWRANSWLEEVHKEYYVSRLMKLELGTLKTKLPQYVSVTEDSNCKTCLSDLIPVKNNKNEKQYTFGVCVHQGLYGSVEPQKVMEWIEVHRLLGAEVITIYFQDDLVDVYRAIEPYVKEGIVEVLQWRLREPVIRGYTRSHGQSGTIDECAYRNLYKVKYLAMYDIDEFFIPQYDMITWHDMFKKIGELIHLDMYASYAFYNTYFFDSDEHLPEAKLLKAMCPKISMPLLVKRTTRAADPETYDGPKIFFQLQAYEAGQVHFVMVWTEGYKQCYIVPVDVGLSHHYRSTIMSKYYREMVSSVTVMSKYAETLLLALEKRKCL